MIDQPMMNGGDTPNPINGHHVAVEYLIADLSAIPIKPDGSKAPKLRSWKPYQSERMSLDEAAERFTPDVGVAIVCGTVSAGLEVLDFDDPSLFDPWCVLVEERFPGLLSKLPIVKTPSEGRHAYLRRQKPNQNQKLAQRPVQRDGKPSKDTLIETRGEGGYVLAPGCPPACHPSGGTYEHISGPALTDLPTRPCITDEEYEVLMSAARSFDLCVEDYSEPAKPVLHFTGLTPTQGRAVHRPGDEFNRQARWDEIISPLGWTVHRQTDKATYWCRPGKTPSGVSATTGYCSNERSGDLLYVHSSNAHPFEPNRAYSKFAAFTLLNHSGDFKAAVRTIAQTYRLAAAPPKSHEKMQQRIIQALEDAQEKQSPIPLIEIGSELAQLDAKEYAIVCEQAESALGTRFKRRELDRVVRSEREQADNGWTATRTEGSAPSGGRDTIMLNERVDTPGGIELPRLDPYDIHAQAIGALTSKNSPPRLFWRGGLCRAAADGQNEIRIQEIRENELRTELLRVAQFRALLNFTSEAVDPSSRVIQALLGRSRWNFPRLEGIARAPIVRRDGSVCTTRGYDAVSEHIYWPDSSLDGLLIPDMPTQSDAQEAAELAAEIFCDVPFEDQASRANATGTLIAPLLRTSTDGCFPMALVDAPQPASGKTLIAQVTAILATGKEGYLLRLRDDEELDKQITQALYKCEAVIIIDNVKVTVEASSIESAITSRRWTSRVLGKNTESVDVPNNAVWAITGNNLMVGSEVARRGYLIRIVPDVASPENRTNFRHPRLLSWVRTERRRLLIALLTMIRAWWVAGKPKWPGPPPGNFEDWAEIIGGVLYYAGIEGFLENRERFREKQDVERAQWERFLRAFLGNVPEIERGLRAGQVVERVRANREVLDSLPRELARSFERDGPSVAQTVGYVFSKRAGRRVSDDGLRVEAGPEDTHAKSQTWRVVVDA